MVSDEVYSTFGGYWLHIATSVFAFEIKEKIWVSFWVCTEELLSTGTNVVLCLIAFGVFAGGKN